MISVKHINILFFNVYDLVF